MATALKAHGKREAHLFGLTGGLYVILYIVVGVEGRWSAVDADGELKKSLHHIDSMSWLF